MKNIVFFDLETTGISKNPAEVRIIEISALKVDSDFKIIDKMYYKCNNDGVPIDSGAFEKHSISENDLKDCPTFTEVAKSVFNFFKECDIGGHYCTSYDVPILFESFLRAGLIWNFRELKVYDTYTIYKKYNSGKLGELYKKYTGQDLEKAHRADIDTIATLEVFKCQTKEGQILEEAELSTYSDCLDIMGNFMIGYKPTGEKYVYLTFGKYKGKPIEEVDPSYLEWIAGNEDGFPTDTRLYARKLAAKLKK